MSHQSQNTFSPKQYYHGHKTSPSFNTRSGFQYSRNTLHFSLNLSGDAKQLHDILSRPIMGSRKCAFFYKSGRQKETFRRLQRFRQSFNFLAQLQKRIAVWFLGVCLKTGVDLFRLFKSDDCPVTTWLTFGQYGLRSALVCFLFLLS